MGNVWIRRRKNLLFSTLFAMIVVLPTSSFAKKSREEKLQNQVKNNVQSIIDDLEKQHQTVRDETLKNLKQNEIKLEGDDLESERKDFQQFKLSESKRLYDLGIELQKNGLTEQLESKIDLSVKEIVELSKKKAKLDVEIKEKLDLIGKLKTESPYRLSAKESENLSDLIKQEKAVSLEFLQKRNDLEIMRKLGEKSLPKTLLSKILSFAPQVLLMVTPFIVYAIISHVLKQNGDNLEHQYSLIKKSIESLNPHETSWHEWSRWDVSLNNAPIAPHIPIPDSLLESRDRIMDEMSDHRHLTKAFEKAMGFLKYLMAPVVAMINGEKNSKIFSEFVNSPRALFSNTYKNAKPVTSKIEQSFKEAIQSQGDKMEFNSVAEATVAHALMRSAGCSERMLIEAEATHKGQSSTAKMRIDTKTRLPGSRNVRVEEFTSPHEAAEIEHIQVLENSEPQQRQRHLEK